MSTWGFSLGYRNVGIFLLISIIELLKEAPGNSVYKTVKYPPRNICFKITNILWGFSSSYQLVSYDPI